MIIRARYAALALALAVPAELFAQIAAPAVSTAARPGDLLSEVAIPTIARLKNIVTGSDGNLWYADPSHVIRTTPAGITTSFSTPTAGGPNNAHTVAAGPDGNVWYINTNATSSNPNVMGRVTPAGAITEFSLPTGQRLSSLTAGPDGNMWAVYQSAGSASSPLLAKVTPAGVVATYPIDAESQVGNIVAGPGGRLWWADRNGAAIKSVLASNPTLSSFQSFPVNLSQHVISAGADGNIWFTQDGGTGNQSIGRLTPSGAIDYFPVTGVSSVSTLQLGPDGNQWFSTFNSLGTAGLLCRMGPDGTLETFALPSPTFSSWASSAIAPGPDGNLWYIENNRSKLAYVSSGSTTGAVLNQASGFAGPNVRLTGPGSTLRFVFTGPTAATATDSSGMSLFNSGSLSFTTSFSYTYNAAGSYSFVDTLNPSHTGVVEVPPTASPNHTFSYGNILGASGNYQVRWASGPPPSGYVYDVQVQGPGGTFADAIIGTTDATLIDRPFAPGTYAYRARLRRTSDDAASGYSPEVRVHVGQGVADFDGDIQTDVSVFRPADGTWYQHSPLAGDTGTSYGTTGDVPIPGDYDGDGTTDIGIFRPSTGLWAMHRSSDGGDVFLTYGGVGGDVPIPADYDGDGKTDLAIFRPSLGTWWIHRSSDDTDVAFTFGVDGDVAVPADFDNDGKADLAVFRNGSWFIHQSSDNVDIATTFGTAGDVPAVGDYDGDGRADLALFRPSNGVFYTHPSSARDAATGFFQSGDIPAPGDYNADGKTDIAVFRPSDGNWYVHSSDGLDSVTQWGTGGDIPLPLPAPVQQSFYP